MLEYEKLYYREKYKELERKYDSSIVFILSMLRKLNPSGILGFISSLTWQTGENYRKLREYLFSRAGVVRLLNLPFDVFKSAYVDTGIYILSKASSERYEIFRFPKRERLPSMEDISYTHVPVKLVVPPDYKIVLDPVAQQILTKASSNGLFASLGDFTISTQGLASNRYQLKTKANSENWYPFMAKGQVYRYCLEVDDVKYANMDEQPSLKRFYESGQKILIRRVVNRQDRLMATLFNGKMVFKKDINPFVITDKKWNLTYVLGILNSQLLSYLYVNTSSIATKDDFRQTTLAELRRLPIPSRQVGLDIHDRMVSLVKKMLTLHEKLPNTKSGHHRTVLQRQIAATDRQIDQLVYELYELHGKPRPTKSHRLDLAHRPDLARWGDGIRASAVYDRLREEEVTA